MRSLITHLANALRTWKDERNLVAVRCECCGTWHFRDQRQEGGPEYCRVCLMERIKFYDYPRGW